MAFEEELTPEEIAATQPPELDAAPKEAPSEEQQSEVDTAEVAREEQRQEQQRETAQQQREAVPHGAFHAEREARKAADARNRELEERLAALEAKSAPPEDPEPQFADPLEDPEGHRRWVEYQTQKPQDQYRELVEQQQAQATAQARAQQAAQAEAAYAKDNPEYVDAVQFLQAEKANELMSRGYSEAQIRQEMSRQANMIFDAASQIGMNPARFLHIMAQDMGFKPAAKADDRIAAQAKAQQASVTLGQGGGEAQSTGLTAEQIANMSEKEFAKLTDEQIAKVFGG